MYSAARFKAQGIQPRLASHDHAALDAWIAQTSTVCQALQAAASVAELGSSSSKIKLLRSQQDAMLIRVPQTAVSKYIVEASTALQQLCAALGHGLSLGSCTQLLQDKHALEVLVKASHLIWIILQGVQCFTTEIYAGRLDAERFAGCGCTCMQAVEGSGLLAAFTALCPALAAILSPVDDTTAAAAAADASSSSSLQDAVMQLSEGLINIWALTIQINCNTPPFQPETWGPTLLPMAALIAAVVRAWQARAHSGGGGGSSSASASSSSGSTRSSRKRTAKRDKQMAAAAAARAAQESAFGPITLDNIPPMSVLGFIPDQWARTSSAAMQAGLGFITMMRSGWSHTFFAPLMPCEGAAADFKSWLAALTDMRQQPRADQPSSLLHVMLLTTAFLAARLHSECLGAVPGAASGAGKALPAGSSSEQCLAIPAFHERLLAAVDPEIRKAYTSATGVYTLPVAGTAFAHLFGDGSIGPLTSCSASPSSGGPLARWLYSSSRQEVVASVLLLVEVSLLEAEPALVCCWLRLMHELLQAHWRCLDPAPRPAQGGSWEGAAELLPALLLHLAPAVVHLTRSQQDAAAPGAVVKGDLTSSFAGLVCRLLVLVPPGQLPLLLRSLLEQPPLAWQGLELAARAAQDGSWDSLHTITALFQAATPSPADTAAAASSRAAGTGARPALQLSQAAVQLLISSLKRAAAMAAASPDTQPRALGAVGCSLLAGLGSFAAVGAAGSRSDAGNEELPGLVLLTARTLHSAASALVSVAAEPPKADGTPPGSAPGAAELAGTFLDSVEWLCSKLALLHLPGNAEQCAAALAKLQQKQRKALRALQRLLQQEQQVPGSGASAEGGGAGAAAEQLQQFAGLVCVQLPTTLCCNSPACLSLSGPSEAQLVSGKECICSGCKVARYCSRECQTAHWPLHRSVCKVLKRGG